MTELALQNPLDKQVDHPLQVGWLQAGSTILGEESPQRQALIDRFTGLDGGIKELLGTVIDTSVRVDTHRHTHERQNSWKLEVGAAAVEPVSIAQYYTLAGQPERVGEYMNWFARITTATYAYIDDARENKLEHFMHLSRQVGGAKEFYKIALDLGGKRQVGDWGNTRQVDEMARSIPERVMAEDPRARVILLEEATQQHRGYKFFPWYGDGESSTDEMKFGIVRRRRRVADFGIPEQRRVALVKESSGLVVLSEVQEQDRDVILREHYAKTGKENEKTNCAAALAAGRAFERAITQRDSTREVVPLHAHYYMLVRSDSEVVAA